MATTNLKVQLTPQDNLLVTNYRVFQGSAVRLSDIFDVDVSDAVDGALLAYDGSSSQWKAKTEIFQTNVSIDGGEF